mmetsp:Transcript_62980/g.113035  ORF Transcript_62980/g.113035 Transcript_62980/m.113035 type:complete len:105 (+) Transcript_62980:2-316(+)
MGVTNCQAPVDTKVIMPLDFCYRPITLPPGYYMQWTCESAKSVLNIYEDASCSINGTAWHNLSTLTQATLKASNMYEHFFHLLPHDTCNVDLDLGVEVIMTGCK